MASGEGRLFGPVRPTLARPGRPSQSLGEPTPACVASRWDLLDEVAQYVRPYPYGKRGS
jgi:hypothetical protein